MLWQLAILQRFGEKYPCKYSAKPVILHKMKLLLDLSNKEPNILTYSQEDLDKSFFQ